MHNLFLAVEGQERASKILTEIYNSQRIPNALLFSGIEGIGKHFAAIQFLKLLNSSNASDLLLKKIEDLSEPYIKLVFPLPRGRNETNNDPPTAKLTSETISEIQEQIKLKSQNPYHKISIKNANNIKINSIRDINKLAALNFDEIDYRGIIINDAHKMSIEAQNAFLKNLEEPPEGILYILITNEPDKLLTTIKSRCWQINFDPLKIENVSSILEKYFSMEKSKFELALPFSQGSITKALFLLENDIHNYLEKTIIILRYSLAKKYNTAYQEFLEIIETKSTVAFQILLDLIITWFNDSIKQKYLIENINFYDNIDTLEKFNKRFNKANINGIINNLVTLRNSIHNNVSLNLLAMNVIFEIASIGIDDK